MKEKLDVQQVYKDSKGNIKEVKTKNGKVYSEEQLLNSVENEISEVDEEGKKRRENYKELVKEGITYGAKVDEDILE